MCQEYCLLKRPISSNLKPYNMLFSCIILIPFLLIMTKLPMSHHRIMLRSNKRNNAFAQSCFPHFEPFKITEDPLVTFHEAPFILHHLVFLQRASSLRPRTYFPAFNLNVMSFSVLIWWSPLHDTASAQHRQYIPLVKNLWQINQYSSRMSWLTAKVSSTSMNAEFAKLWPIFLHHHTLYATLFSMACFPIFVDSRF